MLSADDIYKADLAEYSYTLYERFLHKVFMDYSINIKPRNQIMLYCFLHRGISYPQLLTLFGEDADKSKALSMTIKRLKDKAYLISLKNLRNFKTKIGDSAMNTFIITAIGAKYCSELVKSLFSDILPFEELSTSDHTFTLDEVVNYLSLRCTGYSPVYWKHYLATRDIETYLLSSTFANPLYRFETEVGIDSNGKSLSLYSRALLGHNKLTYPGRSDALIYYPMTSNTELKFFVELDTSSQSSSSLSGKVQNYMENYLTTPSFSPLSSLLFCLFTTVKEDHKDLAAFKGKFGSREFYHLYALECSIELLSLSLPGSHFVTVGDALNYLRNLEQAGSLSPSLAQLINFFSNTAAVDETVPISEMKKTFYHNRYENLEKKNSIISSMHQKKYIMRRSLLHNAMHHVPRLEEFFLKGFSLYTVPNYNMDGTLPYLLPEMFQFENKLKRMLTILDLLDRKDDCTYEPLYSIYNDTFVMRNSYLYQNKGIHIIIENVSDDLGGLCRIRHLLNLETLPSALISSKVICLFDNSCMDHIKEMYLDSKMGAQASSRYGSSCMKDVFEILFATYDTIRTLGSFFTFSCNGDIIYKHN